MMEAVRLASLRLIEADEAHAADRLPAHASISVS
jgi:hypothetical protein